jgi:hypothetical protein
MAALAETVRSLAAGRGKKGALASPLCWAAEFRGESGDALSCVGLVLFIGLNQGNFLT